MPTRRRPARRYTGRADPLLTSRQWRGIKAYWRRVQDPCRKCGQPIDYDDRTNGPRCLHVGHIVGRDEARALGWTDAEINAITNTQPECQTCSTSSGATYGNQKRRPPRAAPPRPIEADEW